MNPRLDQYGNLCYYNKEGRLHRNQDHPAVSNKNGYKEWLQNGERHRENDKPAEIYSSGEKGWYNI